VTAPWRFPHPGRALALLATALTLAACGNDPNQAPLRQTREDGTPWTVRYAGTTEDPRSLDPQFMYDQISRRVLEPIYDTLLEYHPMKLDPFEVVPCMLETMPQKEVSAEGGITYLCKLKSGILFHDDICFPGGKGREVVAADVEFAWKRLCDPKVESPFHSNLAEYLAGFNEARGTAEKAGTFDYAKPLPAIDVLDRFSFRIHLTKPFPQIIYWLALHCTTPVAREAVEYYDGKVHDGKVRGDFHKFQTVGHGPYRLRDYVPRQMVRLERVPGYQTTVFPSDDFPPEKAEWLKTLAGKPLPFIDEVQMRILRENIPIFVLTRQGYLDGMGVNKDAFNAILNVNKELAPKYRERGMFLDKDVDVSTFWLSFNLDDPVIGKNKKLRQALSCAYDNATYSEIFFSSVAPVAEQFIPPGIFGHQKDWQNPYGFDPAKAHQLLAEAGYPGGRDAKTGRQLEITIEAAASGSEDRQRAEFEQHAFETLGIKVKISENSFARLLEREDQGAFQMASGTGWGADYPDPENFFFLYYSKNVPPQGKNISRYNNPEFDRLYEQMATMENTPERLEIVKRMNAIISEDVPAILNFHKAFYTVVQPWARRTQGNPMLEGGIKYGLVDAPLREQKRREWNRQPAWPLFVLIALFASGVYYALRWNRRQNA